MSDLTRFERPLVAADGVLLSAHHLPPESGMAVGVGSGAAAVVLVPGFSGWSEKPAVAQVTADLRRAAPELGFVLLDLRGHGRSGGTSTLGDREVLDVDAAVVATRALGYDRVVTLGWSMGGTCVLRHAALAGGEYAGLRIAATPDAVATVSAVSRWEVRDTVAMRRLHRIVQTRAGRLFARRVLHVRIDPAGWSAPPMPPVEAATRIAVPLLVVHGEKDHYFGWEHARALASAAPAAVLWLVRGLGHAEEAAVRPDVPGFVERLAAALSALAAGRPVDDWDDRSQTTVGEPS